MRLTSEQRAVLDDAVWKEIAAEGQITSYAVACRVERATDGVLPRSAGFWRWVDSSLQRLRKKGRIKTQRVGSFSYWSAP